MPRERTAPDGSQRVQREWRSAVTAAGGVERRNAASCHTHLHAELLAAAAVEHTPIVRIAVCLLHRRLQNRNSGWK